MPIELVTGLPGAGKTLLTIARIREQTAKDGRQVFQKGIKELTLPWPEWEPEKWQELEAGSIFIIDECQKAFPVRGRDRPPPWIEGLAEHRHKGVDFVLITQNPMLIDSFVRRLVGRHFHIVRKFNTHFATVHEFPTGVKENVATSREGSITHEQRYPKDVFELYKSAEMHTMQRRVPMRVWLLLAIPFILAALVWYLYLRLNPNATAERVDTTMPAASAPFAGETGFKRPGTRSPGSAERKTAEEYVADYVPRLADFPHTAPVYDEVTKPQIAPYPAACLATKTRCKCYTQQGTVLPTETQSWCAPSCVEGTSFEASDLAPLAGEGRGGVVRATTQESARAGRLKFVIPLVRPHSAGDGQGG